MSRKSPYVIKLSKEERAVLEDSRDSLKLSSNILSTLMTTSFLLVAEVAEAQDRRRYSQKLAKNRAQNSHPREVARGSREVMTKS